MQVQEYLVMPCAQGERNHNLFCAVLSAREQGWNEHEIREQLAGKAQRDGLSEHEINNTISSAMRRSVEHKESVLQWDGRIGGRNKNLFLAWNDTISAELLPYPTSTTVPQPRMDWQHKDLCDYLNALYEPSEIVSYLVGYSKDKTTGQCKPNGRGVYVRTCQDLLNDLHDKTAMEALHAQDECGAWIRLNPTDGHGVYDKNVTNFRHALVEADGPTIEQQWQVIQKLKLPCTTVVHSGGKSLHAAVRIDADNDPKEYARRVAKLYAILEANGLKIDTQNKNPSRLSRMPGVTRNGNPQYLVASNIGLSNWADWIAHVEQETDDMPLPESYAELRLNPPPLSPEMIHGILRRGHKLMLGGPSKAGKSYGLIQLAAAVAGGGEWFGARCEKGNVLYINLEIDRASFVKRVVEVEKHIKFDPERLTIWNLRGRVMMLDKLAVRLHSICKGRNFDMIILDPIYKISGGDENSAKDMTLLCNLIESIAAHSGAAVVFTHHFSKGQQGAKASIDRASGSGVFGRDPDAIGTLTELETLENEDKNKYKLEWTLREFISPPVTNWEFIFPCHVRNDILNNRKNAGSGGRPKSLFPEQVMEAVQTQSNKTIANIAKILNTSTSTIKRIVTTSYTMRIENGQIVIDDSDSKGF
jgi:RecA-family ATPase